MTSHPQDFTGKVAIVTGAAGGLGTVLTREFAARGAIVYAADMSVERGQAAAAAAREAGGRAEFVELDVGRPESWQALVQRVQREWGKAHVLVNNAGLVSRTTVRSVPLAEWQRVLDVNLTGPMLGMQAVAPLMREAGGAAIVNIASTAALVAHSGIAYCASKWGLLGATKSAALDLVPWGIRVNAVCPTQIAGTDMTLGASPGWRLAGQAAVPMKRAVDPQEVTQVVLFLASDAASFITGAEIPVDGGAISLGPQHMRSVLQQQYEKLHPLDSAQKETP
jgi:3alpha(or 20beta)-hydroxysteroid dehydrogenase